MEFTHDQVKYTITQAPLAVKIDCVDFTSLTNYTVTIDPRKYEYIKTSERLCAILVDGFKGQHKECQLQITKLLAAGGIELNLKVKGYMFKETIVEMLRATNGTTEIQTLSNKIDWLNQKVVQQQTEISELRGLVTNMQKYIPWLQLWYNWIPDGGPYSDRASLIINSFYSEVNNAGCVMRQPPECSLIKITGRYITAVTGEMIVNTDQYPNYPVVDLLVLLNPKEIIISGNIAPKGKLRSLIEEEIWNLKGLEKVTVATPISTIGAICLLPNLVELTLHKCGKIVDLEKLEQARALKILNVTTDTKNLPAKANFVVNYIQ